MTVTMATIFIAMVTMATVFVDMVMTSVAIVIVGMKIVTMETVCYNNDVYDNFGRIMMTTLVCLYVYLFT